MLLRKREEANGTRWYGTHIKDDWSGWLEFSSANTGSNRNHLTVFSENSVVYYYVNDSLVGYSDLYATSGKVGVLFYDSSYANQVLYFENVLLTEKVSDSSDIDYIIIPQSGDKSKSIFSSI